MINGLNVDDIKIQLQKFNMVDYVMLLLMLLSCSAIGIYFGFIEKKNKNVEEDSDYLVGGRKMKIIPVSMSLIASFISGISLLGTPTEIYIYGIHYFYITGAIFIMGFVISEIYMPVFHDLQLTSTYQYLQSRFDQRIRLFGAVLFLFSTMSWLPIVCYVPALAFNQVTGINLHLITPIVLIVCVFYTCIGGMKAVIWTDVVQSSLMFIAMMIVIFKGTIDAGGLGVVLNHAIESGRLEPPDYSFDLTTRHTVWSLWIGGSIYWIKTNAISQNMIQRYLSLPTLNSARKALWIFIFGVTLFLFFSSYTGLLIYSNYRDCDPLTTKLVKAKDQLLPLFVMDSLGDWPGLPGFFVAGVFSAALSSLSTGLNSICAVLLEDFFKPFSKKPLTEIQIKYITRSVVAVFGTICIILVFVVEKLGTVLQLSMSLGAIFQGPLLGIFTAGVLLPMVNASGALIGSGSAFVFMTWLCLKAQHSIATGELKFEEKPLSTIGCTYHFISENPMSMLNVNTTHTTQDFTAENDDAWTPIYHISYLWYTLIGSSTTIVISLLASYLIGFNDPAKMDEKLFAPFIRKLIKRPESNDPPNYTKRVRSISLDKKYLEANL